MLFEGDVLLTHNLRTIVYAGDVASPRELYWRHLVDDRAASVNYLTIKGNKAHTCRNLNIAASKFDINYMDHFYEMK